MNGQNGFFFRKSPVRTNDVRWRKHGTSSLKEMLVMARILNDRPGNGKPIHYE
jgi:hypothetical protein